MDLSNAVVLCPNCMKQVNYEVRAVVPGTNDAALVVEPCLECYPSPEEQGYAIGEAKDEAEHDATMTVISKLLSVAAIEPDSSATANLRKLIESDDRLSAFLYLIDKGEK